MRENWDSSVGALYDGGPCTTTGTGKCDVHAQDGNSLAILSGATANPTAAALAGPDTTPDESILAFMASALARPYGNAFYDRSTLDADAQFDQRVYAFISYFELAARFQTAANNNNNQSSAVAVAESAYDELRRLYGHMAGGDPGGTFWEGIGPGGGYYQGGYTSLAHGWSTGVVPLLQNRVLGVMPTGPGFASFDVRPVVVGGGLVFARGVVPTPAGGGISVAWEVGTGQGLELVVGVPSGLVGRVCVPVAEGDGSVARDGEVLWTRAGGVVNGAEGVSFDGGYVVVEGVQGGRDYTFTSSA